MVKAVLVDHLIFDGETLLGELDRLNFPVEAMFWLDLPNRDYWRLIIASPVVAAQGEMVSYMQLDQILRTLDLSGLAMEDISLLDPDSWQFKSFRSEAAASGRIATEKSWERYNGAAVYRWTGQYLRAIIGCDVTIERLNALWKDYRKRVNSPALLFNVDGRQVTLRFHPQHYETEGLQNIKPAFASALHYVMPDCKIEWQTAI
jgi:hypothetical protein